MSYQDQFKQQESCNDKKEMEKGRNLLRTMTEKRAEKELKNTRIEMQERFNKIFSLSSEELNFYGPQQK